MNGWLEIEPFARLIVSLELWLANVVIIGGWMETEVEECSERLHRI